MKRQYIKPEIEVFDYVAEEGFAISAALHRDAVLDEARDMNTMRASEEITEFTDAAGEYENDYWE